MQAKRNVPSLESLGILTLLSVLIAAPAFLMIHLLEPGFVLPAFSILLFSDAAVAAIVARAIHIRINSENVTLWDIAGAFTMMGCAAAIFSEPDQAALRRSSSSRLLMLLLPQEAICHNQNAL